MTTFETLYDFLKPYPERHFHKDIKNGINIKYSHWNYWQLRAEQRQIIQGVEFRVEVREKSVGRGKHLTNYEIK